MVYTNEVHPYKTYGSTSSVWFIGMNFICINNTDEVDPYALYGWTSYLRINFIRINHTDQVDPYVKNWLTDHHLAKKAYLVYLRRKRTNNRNNHRLVTLSPPPNHYLSQQWKTNTKGRKGSTKPLAHKKTEKVT